MFLLKVLRYENWFIKIRILLYKSFHPIVLGAKYCDMWLTSYLNAPLITWGALASSTLNNDDKNLSKFSWFLWVLYKYAIDLPGGFVFFSTELYYNEVLHFGQIKTRTSLTCNFRLFSFLEPQWVKINSEGELFIMLKDFEIFLKF